MKKQIIAYPTVHEYTKKSIWEKVLTEILNRE